MVRLSLKFLDRAKIPEIRKPVPNYKHGFKKSEHIDNRPRSASGIPFANIPIATFPKPDDPPNRALFRKLATESLTNLKNDGLYKMERIITTAQSSKINIKGNQLRIMNFCSNNYLGLSNNPEVVKYTKNIMCQYGAGISSARHISGTQDIHKDLEKMVAKFHERENALLYNSCYDANTGLFDSLLTPEDAVFVDEASHVSIMDGIELCKASKHIYKHLDVVDLEELLKTCDARLKLIATNGIFPSDCSVAPLTEICNLAEKYKAVIMLDDCHGTGIIGGTGRGTEELCDVKGKVDIINSTFSKALGGGSGGYTTGPAEVIELLRQKSKPYLFSNSLPPAMVASGTAALNVILSSDDLVKKLHFNVEKFRQKMTEAGFKLLGECHPLCPIIVGDNQVTANFADKIQWRGVYVVPITYPLSPIDIPNVRAQVTASHTEDDLHRACEAFVYIAKMLKILS